MKLWGLLAAGALTAGFVTACGDDGDGSSDGSSADSGASTFGIDDLGDDSEVTEVELDDLDEFDRVAGIATVDGDVVAVTGDGAVVRSDADGDWVQEDDAEGLDDSVYAVASLGDSVLALTGIGLSRSDDGVQWEAVDASGLDLESVNTIASTGDGLVAIGGNSEGFTVYRSDDGESWTSEDTDGLADSETFSGQFVSSLAGRGDDFVAALGAEFARSRDDSVFGIWISNDGGVEWDEVGTSNDVDGLEDLDQPNTDAVPVLLAVDDGFLAVAGDDDGEATIWRSEDGEEWGDPVALGGPDVLHPHSLDAAAVTADGVVVMTLDDGELVIWRLGVD